MPVLNPMQMMMMLKNGNPRDVAYQIIKTNFPNDPTMQSLIAMGNNGDVQGLQKIAEGILGPQGRTFAAEMQNLMQMTRNI